MTLPLEGITVVALEQAVAAPFATRQLADLGARVLKVEREGSGDFARGYDETVAGMSSYFVWLNRGKESVVLDVKDDADRDLLERLVATADVFVHNLAPGAVARLGLDAATLRPRYPRLVTCGISGYGEHGPYAQKKAYDLLVQCETGLLSVTGTPAEPAKVGISVADVSAGMYAYSGVLTALYERERTGEGTDLHVAMLDALGEWVSQPAQYAAGSGSPPPRSGARHASIAPYGPYLAGDGSRVFVGLQNDREWAVLCTVVMDRPDLVADLRFSTNVRRVANNDHLTPLIEASLAGMSAEQVVARLDVAGIANARMRTMTEFVEHPQLRARDRWRDVVTPVGPVRSLLPPVTVAGREAAMGAVPDVGQHTEMIRAEFGPGPPGARDMSQTDETDDTGAGVSTRTELVTPEPAEALAGLLGVQPPERELPPAWHWVYLLERRPGADLGPDGHPTSGIPAPPGPGRLRMFAGGRISEHVPLRFGAVATRTSQVVSSTEKQGRSGPLTFVTVRHTIEQDGRVALVDENDIVYRAPGTTLGTESPAVAPPVTPECLQLQVDNVLLFRFSALTYNGHRIHYDLAYAAEEGYPGLVVHGPLQALLLREQMRRAGAPSTGSQFSYRLVSPVFGNPLLTIRPSPAATGWASLVEAPAGRVTATGSLVSL